MFKRKTLNLLSKLCEVQYKKIENKGKGNIFFPIKFTLDLHLECSSLKVQPTILSPFVISFKT